MKKYTVWVKCTSYRYAEIEAENLEQAKELAIRIPDDKFSDEDEIEWEIDDVVED